MSPDHDEQLEKLKRSLIGIVLEIDRICRDNDLKYVIVGGTLLGAIRHKGFIPWDDDLDIAMPREDYNRFIRLSRELLPEDLYFRCFETDRNYYLPFGKVCKKGTTYVTELDSDQTKDNEIFVDVFPLDRASGPSSVLLKLRAHLVKGLKAVIIRKKGLNIKKTSPQVRLLQALFHFFPTEKLMAMQQKAMEMGSDRGSYYTNLGSNYHYQKQTMPTDVYFPARTVTFEGRELQAPGDYEYYLNRIYGAGYMELPPVEKRVAHRIVSLNV